MSDDPPDWPRPYFTQPGGEPFLYFVVYGEFGKLSSMSASHYRTRGVPAGLKLSRYQSDQHPGVLDRFREGYLWNEFRARSLGLAAQVAESKECLILQGEIEDCDTLNYLRDSVGLLTFLLDHGGLTIYDPWLFQWWEPDEWRRRIVHQTGPVPRHHVVILTSEESDPTLTWFHTRGMRKFGRPDLSIHNVPAEYNGAVIDLFERFVEFQAFGGIIEDGRQIRLNHLPAGMTCEHRGDLDDPDFNNVHVEIIW
jgi:hypothetical protein